MQAWVLEEVGKINKKEVDMPKIDIRDDTVLVKVRAAGICGSDIPRVYKTGAHKMPLIIGHEFSGELAANGKKVGIFPLIPCRQCEQCRQKKYEMCNNYNYLGSRCNGGFAEYVVVPKWNIIELPDEITCKTAAMLEPMAVAVHAIRRLNPDFNKKIAVIGLGTIGLLITMFLIKMGARDICVVGNKAFQRQKAFELGIDEKHYFDEKMETEVDYIFECVGSNETINMAVNNALHSGSICFVGNPHSDIELDKDVYWKILRRQLTITGSWNSSYDYGSEKDDWRFVIDCLKDGDMCPEKLISHNFSFEELEKGLLIMRDKTEEYIKIMIEV